MLKLWVAIRGYKRQAGAIVMFLGIILPMFGIEIPEEVSRNITLIGTLIFGVGWLDKGGVALSEKLKENKGGTIQ
jgi:hypothetical protein